ncbi:hypothetical protein [Flavonifractor phage Castelnaud]|nr:hypothetical protein [Flavonifractor phage Castelnaud]
MKNKQEPPPYLGSGSCFPLYFPLQGSERIILYQTISKEISLLSYTKRIKMKLYE